MADNHPAHLSLEKFFGEIGAARFMQAKEEVRQFEKALEPHLTFWSKLRLRGMLWYIKRYDPAPDWAVRAAEAHSALLLAELERHVSPEEITRIRFEMAMCKKLDEALSIAGLH